MVLAPVVFRGAQSWEYVVLVLLGTVCVLAYYCISIGRSKFLFDRERKREREKPLLSVCVREREREREIQREFSLHLPGC